MRTSKPISTISYNSQEFLISKLDELISNHKISDYIFINHFAESDEKKNHIHLWIKPNTLLDTMDLQAFFLEYDPAHPAKPFKCIDFRSSEIDDWILYNEHFEPYLASKGESREFHYLKDDFVPYDMDTFDILYNHAHKGSNWALRYQILQALCDGSVNPSELIERGVLSLNMASNLNSYVYMKKHYGLDRGGRPNHEDGNNEN